MEEQNEPQKETKNPEEKSQPVQEVDQGFGFCIDHTHVAIVELPDENNPHALHEVCWKCDEEEKAEDELQERRREAKLNIVELVSAVLSESLDEHIIPHLDILAPSDVPDIIIGIVQANCMEQLQQVATMKQQDAYDYLKQRWYLVTIEFVKSMAKKLYKPEDLPQDEEMNDMIENFAAEERIKNIDAGVACATEGCEFKKEDGLEHCLTCHAKSGVKNER